MRKSGWKGLLIEGWAFVVVAAIAFVTGLLIGDLGASPKVETVAVTSTSQESGGEATGSNTQAEEGAQVFASNGCGSCHTFKAAGSTGTVGPNLNEYLAPDDDKAGIEEMIDDPNAEIAEGYSANIMPKNYGQVIPQQELEQLVEFLIENSPAGGGKPESPGGEEHDVGGPSG
jgi:mono/diheme cytochrome c family protein